MIAGFGALAVDAPLIWPAWLPARMIRCLNLLLQR